MIIQYVKNIIVASKSNKLNIIASQTLPSHVKPQNRLILMVIKPLEMLFSPFFFF